MAQLVGLIVSTDATFANHVGQLLRTGAVPVSVTDDRVSRERAAPDLAIVDARDDISSAMSAIERLRALAPATGIFVIALTSDPDLIVEAMRAGANEFFVWPPPDDTFHGAVRRVAARRDAAQGAKPNATTLVFFGAKGGAGVTTVAVNSGVEIARLSGRSTVLVDLKPGLGEAALFLGVRPKYTLLDAIDNLHRLDRDFLRELATTHKSGLDILGGSDNFDRPGAADSAAVEELFGILARQYDYVVVDAGSQINSISVSALYTADTIFLVCNPDVPSIRNAQRLLERIRQLGGSGDRVRVILNRAADPCPIPPKQIETALGRPIHQTFPSDYKTVSTALNSGVPLALSGKTDIAAEFASFTRAILQPGGAPAAAAPRRGGIGLNRLASIW
jgi:pilus assembly protein CpaE